MKTLEFKTKIKNNQIQIPKQLQSELTSTPHNVRVIMLIDDTENIDDSLFQCAVTNNFLKGYSESDSIYDA